MILRQAQDDRELVIAGTAQSAPSRALAEIAEPRSDIRRAGIVAALFFLVFLGWAAIARLDAAAIAPGTLTVSGQRQAVQHRDGGVVGTIAVKDGQKVAKGQLLLRISAPEVQAQERALTSQAIRLLAVRARLEAEQAGRSIATPVEFAMLADADRAEAMRVLALQGTERGARAATLAARSGALSARVGQSGSQGQGYGSMADASAAQIRLLDEQIEQYRPLAEKGFISETKMRELERARAALEGQRAQYTALVAQSRGAAAESGLQRVEAGQSFREQIGADLRAVEIQLAEVLPKLTAAREQVARTEVRAPASGTVVGLSVFTPGGVVAPGQRLMDIVPDNQPLVVTAKFSPQDADDLRVGQAAEVRFSGIKDRSVGALYGKLTRFSADAFVDERTGAEYFTGEVEVPRKELERLKAQDAALQLRAGLPAQIYVTLRRRTALQYLLEPLFDQFWGAMSES